MVGSIVNDVKMLLDRLSTNMQFYKEQLGSYDIVNFKNLAQESIGFIELVTYSNFTRCTT